MNMKWPMYISVTPVTRTLCSLPSATRKSTSSPTPTPSSVARRSEITAPSGSSERGRAVLLSSRSTYWSKDEASSGTRSVISCVSALAPATRVTVS